nr:twin-arginine translocation pathway signal [uncultured Halomonas sp.]
MGKTSSTADNPQRRRFLRNFGLGTAAVGAAASMGHVTFAQADQGSDAATTAAPDTHYRETDHVRAFYATLRD